MHAGECEDVRKTMQINTNSPTLRYCGERKVYVLIKAHQAQSKDLRKSKSFWLAQFIFLSHS